MLLLLLLLLLLLFTLRYLPSPKAVIAVLNIQADKEGNIKLKRCANDPILDVHVFRSFSTICQISPKQIFYFYATFAAVTECYRVESHCFTKLNLIVALIKSCTCFSFTLGSSSETEQRQEYCFNCSIFTRESDSRSYDVIKGAVSATPLSCLHLGTWLTTLLEIITNKYLITKRDS